MSERYVTITKIGSGTFGDVQLISSIYSNRKYVMKEVRLMRLSPDDLKKTLKEAEMLARCRHVNIIRYKESFLAADPLRMCIVMEYADGGDLHAKVKEATLMRRFIPELSILHWFIQIVFAVQYLHAHNILHRDLKTQNIFLMNNNIIKVGDFGIARFLRDKQDLATTAIGTPYYLSPEICLRKPYNYKSDMWAVGCILYELCTLKHPFEAKNFENLVIKILKGIYAPLNGTYYSKLLHDLTSVLLRTEPRKRPSAEEILIIPSLRIFVNNYIKVHNEMTTDKVLPQLYVVPSTEQSEVQKQLENGEEDVQEQLDPLYSTVIDDDVLIGTANSPITALRKNQNCSNITTLAATDSHSLRSYSAINNYIDEIFDPTVQSCLASNCNRGLNHISRCISPTSTSSEKSYCSSLSDEFIPHPRSDNDDLPNNFISFQDNVQKALFQYTPQNNLHDATFTITKK